MAAKKKARRGRPRRNASEGYAYSFHGSFTRKGDAEAKARKVRRELGEGWYISRKARGAGLRYIVMGPSSGVPF